MPLGLFKGRTFVMSSGISFVLGFAMFGVISYLPLYLQLVHGASATASGLFLLPLMAGVLTASLASGQFISRTGQYRWFPLGRHEHRRGRLVPAVDDDVDDERDLHLGASWSSWAWVSVWSCRSSSSPRRTRRALTRSES